MKKDIPLKITGIIIVISCFLPWYSFGFITETGIFTAEGIGALILGLYLILSTQVENYMKSKKPTLDFIVCGLLLSIAGFTLYKANSLNQLWVPSIIELSEALNNKTDIEIPFSENSEWLHQFKVPITSFFGIGTWLFYFGIFCTGISVLPSEKK